LTGRIRVVIATTEGPSTVLRVTAEDPAVRSVVCLGRTTTTLPISRAYDAFVRAPTGVVERAVGHPSFRVDVSAPIDDGDSWQLGLYLAHRLKAAGRLAEDDEPADKTVWVTGAVDGDLAVHPVERVSEKWRRSEGWLAESGVDLLMVVPSGQAGALGDLPGGAEVVEAGTVGAVLARLGIERSSTPRRARRWPFLAALVGIVGVALGVFAWLNQQPSPIERPASSAPPPVAALPIFDPAQVRLVTLERRPVGGSCAGEQRTELVEPGRETPPGVCGLVVQAINGDATGGFVWLIAVVEGTFREYSGNAKSFDIAVGSFAPGETVEVRVASPSWVRRPVVFRVLLVVSGGDREDVSRALAGAETLSTNDFDRLAEQLIELGLDVRTVRHRVQPRA
jgi:hypothetical protein